MPEWQFHHCSTTTLMKPQHWPEPINEMLSAVDRQDETLWALPVVNALESQSIGTAIDIAVTVLTAQLPGLGAERAALVGKWLTDLNSIKDTSVDPVALGRLSRRIWFSAGSRDSIQTAISRLYAALSALKAQNDLEYRREVAMALAVAINDQEGRPNTDRLRQLIESFLQATR